MNLTEKSTNGRVGGSARVGADRTIAAARKTAAIAVAAALLLGWAAPNLRAQSSGAAEGSAQAESAPNASKWIGMTIHQLQKKLGQPTSSQMLQETTGMMLIYAKPGQTHYVFETGPDGKVRKAAVIH